MSNEKKLILCIKADTNDADYATEQTVIHEDMLPFIREVAAKIAACPERHNWPTSEYCDNTVESLYDGVLTDEEIERFNWWVPYGEHGVHTIKGIKILEVVNEEVLL